MHTEWLSLIEVAGPFLAIPVLEEVFPQGLEVVQTYKRQRLRAAYDEWNEAIDYNDPLVDDIHKEWIKMVLVEILGYDDESLIINEQLVQPFLLPLMEQHVGFTPQYIVQGREDPKPRVLISTHPPKTNLESIHQNDGWQMSIVARMTALCRNIGVRIGLVTNGEQWMLVNAPIGETSSHASWYARLWFQESITLKSFQSLLGVRRCFGPEDENLSSLLDKSLDFKEDVTETLGEQVRHAVEVLIQSLDKADQDRNRELLRDVSTTELYEAGLTVMMRLVFILCAEERGLLLAGEPLYDDYYAVSSLRSQLAEEADHHGPEVLERRFDAWSRLLTVFRAVYSGIEHENVRMPALGGSLFDPDRFPFLEGRKSGTGWLNTMSYPLPIDNRTVLLLLNSLQVLEHQSGALLLSYRALDVEQIGHVYEGLLEYTVERVPEVTVSLVGSKNAKNLNLTLSELETKRANSEVELLALLKKTTQRSESALRNALTTPVDDYRFGRFLSACGGDVELAERIRPFGNLLFTNLWGDPVVYLPQAFIVTFGVDRRETGTHYTPRILTENIVAKTLEPLVYDGPAEGIAEGKWKIKSPSILLNLKICDLAMGSGAFLVQVCRWLAERLVESWSVEETSGKVITMEGEARDNIGSYELLPEQLDERLIIARRLVAERCLYGVDVNPLAVELAKLSIWLVTLAKGRPFGFLDHNLRYGNSLLGIHRLDQLTSLNLHPDNKTSQEKVFDKKVNEILNEAIETRQKLRKVLIRNIHDIEYMAKMHRDIRMKLKGVKLVADVFIGEVLNATGNTRKLENSLNSLSTDVWNLLSGKVSVLRSLVDQARTLLSIGQSDQKQSIHPFHWPIEFPEVFARENGGFDAIIGNPPFIGGRRLRGSVGDHIVNWLVQSWPHASINADYCAFFYLRSAQLLRKRGEFGLLATKTIGEGDTARTGLSFMVESCSSTIRYAKSTFPWPGKASVTAALVLGHIGNWRGLKFLDDKKVSFISPALDDHEGWGEANRLPGNVGRSFQGSVLAGAGFVLTYEEASDYINQRTENKQVIFPYINGEDINSHVKQSASRCVIDFRDKSLKECEERWPELLERIRNLVKPARDKVRREAHRKYWWHHGDKRPALYKAIKDQTHVFVISRVTKYVAFAHVTAKQVFSDAVVVFDFSSWGSFALLQSTFHDLWVRRESSTMGERVRYTSSDSFDTYPFLHINDEHLNLIGKEYYKLRQEIMLENNIGLTDVYNRFHNIHDNTLDIQDLRNLHMRMDKAVAKAYGWEDMNLRHGFYDTKLGMRFTISEEACREVLIRLLKLNQQQYKAEMSKGLKATKTKTNRKSKPKIVDSSPTLLDFIGENE